MAVPITSVIKNSSAYHAGFKAGDILIALNGHAIHDVLDYMYYAAEINVRVEAQRDGKTFFKDIVKSEYDDLGLEFESFLMDKKQSCTNKCIFCFIDQMPPNMRETLYFKDDDARLSFLQGNYVTLTNLSQNDIDRIIAMRLNINISVHTTNPELRCKMMNNRFAGEKLKYLKQFADAGIAMNCQIVLCPGINDGSELERTLTDLGDLMPNIQSIAVVPVGLTKFREDLYHLELFNKETASKALDLMEDFQKKFFEKYDTRLVFPADEFYITAERELPCGAAYEDYCQYENGVGMLRSLSDEFESALETADEPKEKRTVSIVTGAAAHKFISEMVEKAEKKWHNIKCNVYRIDNKFFGETITVTGLLTAGDIIAQLKGKPLGDALIISTNTLKRDTDIFLDDLTVPDVEKALDTKILVADNDGFDLLDKILGV
jgi:putative radical SAM enzyme (TIGR03279 family)